MNTAKTPLPAAGMLFIRVLLGIIFLMQGYGKVFTIGLARVYEMFFRAFENSFLPSWLIISTNYFTAYTELVAGFLLITGLFRQYAMYLLALDLLIVSFGHGLMEPIWDLSHVFPRAVLLSALFLLPSAWDRWNADALLEKRRFPLL